MLGMGGLASMSSMSDPPSNVIMVTNLPALITEEQIKELFSPFGTVSTSKLVKNKSHVEIMFYYILFLLLQTVY